MATQIPVKKEGMAGDKTGGRQGLLADMENWAGSWTNPFHMPFHLLDRPFLHESMPRCDVVDRDNEILVRAALPGFKKNDIEVSATDSSVTIQGKAGEETEEGEKEGEFYRREIRTENFMRMIRLPAVVEDKQAKACFKDGLLEVTLPKTTGGKRHTLEIEG